MAPAERREQLTDAGLEQLERVVPENPGDRDPIEVLAAGVRRFLEAVASRPATWRIILLPLEGTPQVVRDHVETNRACTQERIANLVRWVLRRPERPDNIDIGLTARAIRVLSEDAGRTLLTDPESYRPGGGDSTSSGGRYRGLTSTAMRRCTELVLGHRRLVLAAWAVALLLGSAGAANVGSLLANTFSLP